MHLLNRYFQADFYSGAGAAGAVAGVASGAAAGAAATISSQ